MRRRLTRRLPNTDTIGSAAVARSTTRWVVLAKVAPKEHAAALLGLGVNAKQSKPAFALIAKGLELRDEIARAGSEVLGRHHGVDAAFLIPLNEARLPGAPPLCSLAFSEKRQLEDLPAESSGAPRRTVYQLFGKLDGTGDYGITEEKILEFTHRLQSRDQRPQNLFDALRAKNLLAVGCSLPGWLARFLLRATKGDQLFTQGSHGVIADRASRSDAPFVMFLERRQTAIYTDGDAVQFVDELHRHWMERFGQRASPEATAQSVPTLPQIPDFKLDSVFLSYASEDREVALRVKQSFDEAGVDVWFDQSALESGDDYRRKVETNIENCSCFVPLISRHTATLEKRFFRREWSKAIHEAEEFPPGYPFIQPILLDDTPLDSLGIPREFRDRHARKLEALPQLIEDAKKLIRERRLKKRPA